MRYVDHSRTTTDWTCPRSRYWGYEHKGGISLIEPNINLTFGSAIADAAEAIRRGQEVPVYDGPLPHLALYQGLTEAYKTRIWPQWECELIAAELECVIKLAHDVTYMARPDAVVKKADGTYWYIQDKTTSQKSDNFCRGWEHHAELHATALAVEKACQIEISGAYVQGWYKGYPKENTLYSPLAYCWQAPGQPGISKSQLSFEYRRGWARVPITTLDIGAWVKSLPEVIIQEQFPVVGPISFNRRLADLYLNQVRVREQEIALREHEKELPMFRDFFPMHFSQCDEYSKFRSPCPWRDCCWSPVVGNDPLGSGMYQLRIPHHTPEEEAQLDAPTPTR